MLFFEYGEAWNLTLAMHEGGGVKSKRLYLIMLMVAALFLSISCNSAEKAAEQARQEQERVRVEQARQEQTRLEQAKAAEEERQRREAEEKQKLKAEAWDFIRSKFPISTVSSYETGDDGVFIDDRMTHYTERKREIFLSGNTLTYVEYSYKSTTKRGTTGALDSTTRYEVDLSEIDPTRIEGSGGSYASVNLYVREKRDRIKCDGKYDRSSMSLYVGASDSEPDRRAAQMAKAFYQLVVVCGGHGEKF